MTLNLCEIHEIFLRVKTHDINNVYHKINRYFFNTGRSNQHAKKMPPVCFSCFLAAFSMFFSYNPKQRSMNLPRNRYQSELISKNKTTLNDYRFYMYV